MLQETKQNHTELPWQVKNDYMDSHFIIADIDCDDGQYSFKFVAETLENDIIGRANAQFIVKACNEHYADKAKIREQEELIGKLVEGLKSILHLIPQGWGDVNRIEDLIAKAEGK